MTFPENPWWTVGGGGIDTTDGSATTFTAASNACTATVTVQVRDVKLAKSFSVLEPSGYDHAKITSTHTNEWLCPPTKVAAQMFLDVWMSPTSVSFYRVQFSEVGSNGVPYGYFADTNLFPDPWYHNPNRYGTNNYNWQPLAESNYFSDWAGFIPVYLPLPWDTGELSFDIPAVWRIESDGQTNSMSSWNQTVNFGASGTVMVTKFGQTVLRTQFNVISPSR
jgi:hypothetical protein